MHISLSVLIPLALLPIGSACGGVPPARLAPGPAGESRLEITNDHFNDVIVFAVRDGMTTRLGWVSRMQTATFSLPSSPRPGSERLVLIAKPLGSLGPQRSSPVYLEAGQNLRARVTNSDEAELGVWVDTRRR